MKGHLKSRLFSVLLVMVMFIGMLPLNGMAQAVKAAGNRETQAHVIIKNETFSVVDGAAWEGVLVDSWVDVDEDSTMMSAIVDALTSEGFEQEGAENNYISSIEGLSEFDGGASSGWVGTLNDWFTNEGFASFSVVKGNFHPGDEICIMYTCGGLSDSGGTIANNDKSLRSIDFVQYDEDGAQTSIGILDRDFDPEDHELYILTLMEGQDDVIVLPSAANKNFQVNTQLNNGVFGEYRRWNAIPVKEEDIITVKVGDPAWPSMNNQGGNTDSEPAQTYSFKISFQSDISPDPAAAQEVDELIKAIGTVTLESETKIIAARTAYDQLTAEQKALVIEYDVLTDAEKALAALKGEDKAASPVDVKLTISYMGELAKDKNSQLMAERPVSVIDENEDGQLTVDEVMVAGHKAYSAAGKNDFRIGINGYAEKLWGVETGSLLFFKNDEALMEAINSISVEDGDYITAAIMLDEVNWADWYAYFDKRELTQEAGEEITLTMKGFVGMSYDPATVGKGVTVKTTEGTVLGTTDENGVVRFQLDQPGTVIVTASGSVPAQVTDWSTMEAMTVDAPIIAPVCIITVTENSKEPETEKQDDPTPEKQDDQKQTPEKQDESKQTMTSDEGQAVQKTESQPTGATVNVNTGVVNGTLPTVLFGLFAMGFCSALIILLRRRIDR